MLRRLVFVLSILLTVFACRKNEEADESVVLINNLISGNNSSSFHREIAYGSNIRLNSIFQLSNNNYIVCGEAKASSFVGLFNSEGTTLWKSLLKLSGTSYSTAFKITSVSDNEYVIAAYAGYSTRRYVNPYSWVYALDDRGILLWEVIEDRYQTSSLNYHDLIYFNNSYLLFAGKKGPDWYGGGFIHKYSGNERVASIEFIKDSVNSIQSICETEDGGLIACGEYGNYPYKFMDVGVIKFNSSLEQVWAKRYKFSNTEVSESIREVDGGYIFSGKSIGMTKIDFEGNIIWQTLMESTYIDLTTDGQIISAEGYFIRKIDVSNGNIIWEKAFKAGPNIIFEEVHETNDLGFILVGNVEENGIEKGVIIKTDKNGN